MNPFDDDIFAEGIPGAAGIHEDELQAFAAIAKELGGAGDGDDGGQPRIHAYGRTALLIAPRAGYGKSHLLHRLAEHLRNQSLFLPLNFEPETPITWTQLVGDLATVLQARPAPRESNLTLLDELARFYFGQLVILGMQRGIVEAGDPQTAMAYVYENYRELFDRDSGEQSRAEWFQDACEPLVEGLAGELASTFAIDEDSAAFWARTFLEYSYPKLDSQRARALALRAALGLTGDGATASPETENVSKRRFCDLAQITSAERPVVFVVDHLDGFHGQGEAGLKIAHILAEIARNVPRSLTVLSMNQEVWNSMFAQSIPSALEDRITWDKRQLEALDKTQAERLIQHRLSVAGATPHEARAFVDSLNLAGVAAGARGSTFTPRTLIRYARRMWLRFDKAGAAPSAEVAAKTVPFPANGIPTPPKPPEPTPIRTISPPPLEPAAAEETRERLKAVAEAIRQQSMPTAGGSSEARSLVDTGTVRPAPPAGAAPFVPGSMHAVFQEYRLKHLETGVLRLDSDKILELVRAVGEHFPAVQQSEAPEFGGAKGKALIWKAQAREIYLGFAAQTDYQFWQEMITAGHERARELAPDPKLKLVVFSPKTEPFPMARLFVSREQAQEVSKLVDRVEMDQELLASLYAAADLLKDQREGEISFSSAQVYGFIATELDYFWRRLTRLNNTENRAAG